MSSRRTSLATAPVLGDPGVFGPESVTWRVHADPLMGVAGLRALFLQALHPVAMAAVDQNSRFRDDVWGRLGRTAEWVGIVSYGTTAEAERASAHVRDIHRRVRGRDAVTGRSYRADDADLLLWVHAGLVDSFLSVTRRGGLGLTDAEADRYVDEQRRSAALMGLDPSTVPATTGELDEYVRGVRLELRATPAARTAVRFVLAPPMPLLVSVATPARPAWASLGALALGALPRWARRMYRLPALPTSDLTTTVALAGLRRTLLALPTAVREGPQLRAARERLAAADL